MLSGLSLPSFVSKVSLELCLTELCQLTNVLYSQDVCNGSAKLASQVTAKAGKKKEKEASGGDCAKSFWTSCP